MILLPETGCSQVLRHQVIHIKTENMKNLAVSQKSNVDLNTISTFRSQENRIYPEMTLTENKSAVIHEQTDTLPEILFVSSYPPRECGIATYSQDLIKVLKRKFRNSFDIKICALESGIAEYDYPDEVKYKLDTSQVAGFHDIATSINKDNKIKIVLIQHEFGFFQKQEAAFLRFINKVTKPVVVVFHTVLPLPGELLKATIRQIATASTAFIVMTNNSAKLLVKKYGVPVEKITVIAHGTHLVPPESEAFLKEKYGLKGRKVLTTFGLLSSGKSIETTLIALPAIIKTTPEVMFLIIGKTHPEVVKSEGEKYREMLEALVIEHKLSGHVKFVNSYLSLPVLLEYLQLTDIYLFTTNDPNQAVSGTFAYAMSCGCPIISTPIPHAMEVLTSDTGLIFDFRNSEQLADNVISLLNNEPLRRNMSTNALQKIVSTTWENSAIAHARLFEKISKKAVKLRYNLPAIHLDHLKRLTTDFGIIQFSKINQPDPGSGYTLDDNARALVAICMHYELTLDDHDLEYIQIYLNFIRFCLQQKGDFLNYVDSNKSFTAQNKTTNLDDANGRGIWALGYLISKEALLPEGLILNARAIIQKALPHMLTVYSPRSMALAIKGLYYSLNGPDLAENTEHIRILANRLLDMYRYESTGKWGWFESYLTYANSILPEAMLCAWLATGDDNYKEVALESFDFLLAIIFSKKGIEVISNKSWLKKGQEAGSIGQQPIDVAYTIIALSKFYDAFKDVEYRHKLVTAFNWFLGNNHLHQIIYNPCTGGCYDGLEENNVNLNQGAESTVSYLMARLTIEKYKASIRKPLGHARKHFRSRILHSISPYTLSSES